MLILGFHAPIKETLLSVEDPIKKYNLSAIQIFAHTPYKYFVSSGFHFPEDEVRAFKELTKDITVVIHTCFIMNLASPKPQIYNVSKKSLLEDCYIADLLGAKYVVTHSGSFTEASTLSEGIDRIRQALIYVLTKVPNVTILLENSAGKGTAVGSNFFNLSEVIDGLDDEMKSRVGIAFDTAHAWGAGYDFTNELALQNIKLILPSIKVVHFNMPDPTVACGSGRDRHKVDITSGAFPLVFMQSLFNLFRHLPLILERPFNKEEAEMDWGIIEKDLALVRSWDF